MLNFNFSGKSLGLVSPSHFVFDFTFLSKYYWWCHDSSNFDHLFQENFDKESKSFSQLSQKENHRRVSSPSKTIVLNEASLESEESFLLDQSTSSTLTHELNLNHYSSIENIRSKNPNGLMIAQLNIISLRYKFDSLVEILNSKWHTFNFRN